MTVSLRRAIVVAAMIAVPALASPTLAQPFRSTYTTHDYEECRRLPARRGEDEDIVTRRRCAGHAGIPVTFVNEPDSSSLAFGTEGLVGDYGERFGFAVAGNRIEWRGPETGGRIRPFAAIVRFQLCRSVQGPCRPELVLFRLEGARRSCLAASISGARRDANERARAVADDFVRGFRCAVDRAREPE